MTAVSEEAKAKQREYHRQWYHDHKSPEQNKARYASRKSRMTQEQIDHENTLRRIRRQKKAAEKKANETEEERQAKIKRRLDAVIAANKARAKPPEERAKPKPRAQKTTAYQAILSNKRKPGRLLALAGWRGTGL
jgi:hypothetical protein